MKCSKRLQAFLLMNLENLEMVLIMLMKMAKTIIITVLITWFIIATITVVTGSESVATFPVDLVISILRFPIRLFDSIFVKPIPRDIYEEIKECGFYKRPLAGNWHLVTLYGNAGDKRKPLYKRILSHVYMVVHFEIVDK